MAIATTVNPASQRHIGLHVDNWGRLPNTLQPSRAVGTPERHT
ncbi:hypothetical protein [Streptomyces piniterrae]|nr:hypothetical protein [Streptomyces piniterrae]